MLVCRQVFWRSFCFSSAQQACALESPMENLAADGNRMKLFMFYIRGRLNTLPVNCYLINNTRIVTVAFKIFLQTYNIPPRLNNTSIV